MSLTGTVCPSKINRKEAVELSITYKPLWHLLLERDMKKLELRDLVGMSNSTLAKLGKNEPVSMEIIEKICIKLDCRIEDVVEIKKDE